MIIVSACLCGVNCKYNGGNNYNDSVFELFKQGKAVLVCPEQMGGLSTPRLPNEIIKGDGKMVLDGNAKIINSEGECSTEQFIKGAEETLKIARAVGADIAILKSRSPSCGYGKIYDGTFTGNKKEGNGVTAELLKRNGIKVYTEEDMFEFE